MVLPPMVEWARVATAFAEHRNSTHVDSDDVMQVTEIFFKILNFLRFDSNLFFSRLLESFYREWTAP